MVGLPQGTSVNGPGRPDRDGRRTGGQVNPNGIFAPGVLHELRRQDGHAGPVDQRALEYDFDGFDRTVDTHVSNLRRKLNAHARVDQYIKTVYGIGYRFEPS